MRLGCKRLKSTGTLRVERHRWQAKGVAYDVNHWGLLAGELR